MRQIMVMNPKGGCGKTTIATNIAAAYAAEGAEVVLADFDPQGSSTQWLKRRPESAAKITGVVAHKTGLHQLPSTTDFVVMDAPAATRGSALTELLSKAETIIIPVLPSPIDMQATAEFIETIRRSARVQNKQTKLAVIANRVKTYTLIFEQLEKFLKQQKLSYVASLRDAQNYNRAYTRGLGVYELPEYLAWQDWEEWTPVLDWIDTRKSKAA